MQLTGKTFPTGDPDVQLGVAVRDSQPTILLDSAIGGGHALPLRPADAVEIGMMLLLLAASASPDAAQQALTSLRAQQPEDARLAAGCLVEISVALMRAAAHLQPDAAQQALAGVLEQLEVMRRLAQTPPGQAH